MLKLLGASKDRRFYDFVILDQYVILPSYEMRRDKVIELNW